MPRVGSCFIAAGFVRDLRPEPELAAPLPLGRGKITVSRDPMIQAVTGELSAKVSPMTKTIELNARPEKCQQLFPYSTTAAVESSNRLRTAGLAVTRESCASTLLDRGATDPQGDAEVHGSR